jgi:hypothetical protein
MLLCKKYIISLLLALVAIFPSVSQATVINIDYWFGEVYVAKGTMLYYCNESTGEKAKIDNYALGINEDGYAYLEVEGKKLLYIPNYPFTEVNIRRIHNTKMALPLQSGGIKTISESSFLTEKTSKGLIEYRGSGLIGRFAKEAESAFIWNDDSNPWAEGKAGNGEGEKLYLVLEQPVDCISILGGFVDFDKQYLFKQNCRPKQIRITSASGKFSIVCNIEDKVYFLEIELPKKVSDLTIEILQVYPGTRYSDLCISALIAYQKEERAIVDIDKILKQF